MNNITYEAKGEVLGHLWGGGLGGYPTVVVKGETIDEVRTKAAELLDSGGLDSGMGYESLVAAYLDVKEVETRVIDNKTFKAVDYHEIFLGDEKYHDQVHDMWERRLMYG